MLPSSTAASLGPLLARPLTLPSGGQTWQFFPASGAGAVSGRVGKPAKQGGQSLNRLYGAVPSPPRSNPVPLLAGNPVPLLAGRAEAAASQNQLFYYTVGGLGPEEGRGTGGGVMPESPEARGEDTEHQALVGWLGALLGEGKRRPLLTPLTHPHGIK